MGDQEDNERGDIDELLGDDEGDLDEYGEEGNYGEDTIDELLAEDNYDAETDAGHEQQQAEQQQDNVNQQPADHGTVATTQTQDTKEVHASTTAGSRRVMPEAYYTDTTDGQLERPTNYQANRGRGRSYDRGRGGRWQSGQGNWNRNTPPPSSSHMHNGRGSHQRGRGQPHSFGPGGFTHGGMQGRSQHMQQHPSQMPVPPGMAGPPSFPGQRIVQQPHLPHGHRAPLSQQPVPPPRPPPGNPPGMTAGRQQPLPPPTQPSSWHTASGQATDQPPSQQTAGGLAMPSIMPSILRPGGGVSAVNPPPATQLPGPPPPVAPLHSPPQPTQVASSGPSVRPAAGPPSLPMPPISPNMNTHNQPPSSWQRPGPIQHPQQHVPGPHIIKTGGLNRADAHIDGAAALSHGAEHDDMHPHPHEFESGMDMMPDPMMPFGGFLDPAALMLGAAAVPRNNKWVRPGATTPTSTTAASGNAAASSTPTMANATGPNSNAVAQEVHQNGSHSGPGIASQQTTVSTSTASGQGGDNQAAAAATAAALLQAQEEYIEKLKRMIALQEAAQKAKGKGPSSAGKTGSALSDSQSTKAKRPPDSQTSLGAAAVKRVKRSDQTQQRLGSQHTKDVTGDGNGQVAVNGAQFCEELEIDA